MGLGAGCNGAPDGQREPAVRSMLPRDATRVDPGAVYDWYDRRTGRTEWFSDCARIVLEPRRLADATSCGQGCGKLEVDHIVPQSEYGRDLMNLANLRALCGWPRWLPCKAPSPEGDAKRKPLGRGYLATF